MKSRKLISLVAAALLGAFMFSVQGCNTLQGAGQDVERAGEEVQDAAD